jgi:L-amino acid N-acyltransferase YncA
MMKFKNIVTGFFRFLNGLKRPSTKTNLQKLKERGETLDEIIFRDAIESDIQELGKLHAITWAQTYNVKKPNIELRQYQWLKAFTEENDGRWFCIVVVNKNNQLIGFTKGCFVKTENPPGLRGDLNKIYLLTEYQRMGLGSKLFQLAVARFRNKGVTAMTLFGAPQNPSCYFHEAMGGERVYSDKGIFDGNYKWKDLSMIASNYSQHSSSR